MGGDNGERHCKPDPKNATFKMKVLRFAAREIGSRVTERGHSGLNEGRIVATASQLRKVSVSVVSFWRNAKIDIQHPEFSIDPLFQGL